MTIALLPETVALVETVAAYPDAACSLVAFAGAR